MLVWLKKRLSRHDWEQLAPVARTVPGKECKQKSPQDTPHPELRKEDGKPETHEDTIYHKFECGRVLGEMVRPDVAGTNWGGFSDAEILRVAGLARAIQIKLKYPHQCTTQYCLKDRPNCRFFFPRPKQPHQTYASALGVANRCLCCCPQVLARNAVGGLASGLEYRARGSPTPLPRRRRIRHEPQSPPHVLRRLIGKRAPVRPDTQFRPSSLIRFEVLQQVLGLVCSILSMKLRRNGGGLSAGRRNGSTWNVKTTACNIGSAVAPQGCA